MPPEKFQSLASPADKPTSGPMILAAHWAKKATAAFRIQITLVDRSLPSPRFESESKYKRRKPISVRISEAMRRS